MKRLLWISVGISLLAGAWLYHRATTLKPAPGPDSLPVAVSEETSAAVNQSAAAPTAPADSSMASDISPKRTPQPAVSATHVNLEAAALKRAVDSLVAPEVNFGQKQPIWKQLTDAGKLDQAIADLESRMAGDARSAEYPAALGQAYLKKCATLQDLREQGILGMQADKLFDTALNLEPSNWEARFMKAVALSYWPVQMNKGDEVIQHFNTLIQQQEAQAAQPYFAESYVWLGNEYQKLGRPEYARSVWQRGATLFPGNDGLREKLAALNETSTAANNAAATAGQ